MPEWLIDLFARYGYAAVFAGVFLAGLDARWLSASEHASG